MIAKSNYEATILVPNFNGVTHLKECLASLAEQTYQNFITIIVDDASTDNSLNFVRENFPEIKILALEKNKGFARAINMGINYAQDKYQPKYIAILNNDTKVDQAWLKNLVIAIESEENIVAVASNMLYYDRPKIINSQGGKFTFTGYGFDINVNKKRVEVKNPPKYVLASCWGATLIKSEVFQIIGLLDENYYAYFEDLDWGYRANLLGYKIIFAPEAIVYHKGSAFWVNYPFKKTMLCRKNSIYTILKNYEFKNILKALPTILLDYFVLYPAGQLLNRTLENGQFIPLHHFPYHLGKRLKFLIVPLWAWWWNLIHLPKTLMIRRKIQTTRKVSDEEIFKLSRNI